VSEMELCMCMGADQQCVDCMFIPEEVFEPAESFDYDDKDWVWHRLKPENCLH
jgi:hypothetical protein